MPKPKERAASSVIHDIEGILEKYGSICHRLDCIHVRIPRVLGGNGVDGGV